MGKITSCPPWLWRKIVYIAVFGISVVAAARGWIEAGDIEGLASQWAEMITAGISLLAAAKTHPGSDDRTTVKDVATADDAIAAIREVVGMIPAGVVQAIRVEERGEHTTTDGDFGTYVRTIRGE